MVTASCTSTERSLRVLQQMQTRSADEPMTTFVTCALYPTRMMTIATSPLPQLLFASYRFLFSHRHERISSDMQVSELRQPVEVLLTLPAAAFAKNWSSAYYSSLVCSRCCMLGPVSKSQVCISFTAS